MSNEFISDHFPLLIEVYSDGYDEGNPVFRPEFNANGMFVINSEKTEVTYATGLNVLDYDPATGRHNFEVFFLLMFVEGKVKLHVHRLPGNFSSIFTYFSWKDLASTLSESTTWK